MAAALESLNLKKIALKCTKSVWRTLWESLPQTLQLDLKGKDKDKGRVKVKEGTGEGGEQGK